MKFYSRSYGTLKEKTTRDGDVLYTLDRNGKEMTYIFKNDECPQANIGDKLYVSYLRNISFKKLDYRQGVIISHDFKKIVNSSFIMPKLWIFYFIFMSLLSMTTSFLTFLNHDTVAGVYHIFISLFFACFSFLGADSLWLYEIFSKSDNFKQLKEYQKTHFTKKEKIFNKKLNNLEKLQLINFINKQNDISPNIKIEIDDFISKNKVTISSIPYIEIKAIKRNLDKKKHYETLMIEEKKINKKA